MNYTTGHHIRSPKGIQLVDAGFSAKKSEQIIFEMDFLKGKFNKQRTRQHYNSMDLYKVFSFQKNSSKNFGN